MRKALKFLHTLGSCGLIGALAAYVVLMLYGPADTPAAYADTRQSISVLFDYILFPSLGIVLVSGVLSMASHHPFHEMRWVWLKALLGLGMFEGTLGLIGKVHDNTEIAVEIAAGTASADILDGLLRSEWYAVGFITLLAVLNIVLGVWRPLLARRRRSRAVSASE